MTFSIPKLLTRSQVPGTGSQSYMPSPSYTCRLFPETLLRSICRIPGICYDDVKVSTSCNTRVYLPTTRLYPLNPRSTTYGKSNNQNPIHLLYEYQLFLEINHVSASGRLMPSHSHLRQNPLQLLTTSTYHIEYFIQYITASLLQ